VRLLPRGLRGCSGSRGFAKGRVTAWLRLLDEGAPTLCDGVDTVLRVPQLDIEVFATDFDGVDHALFAEQPLDVSARRRA